MIFEFWLCIVDGRRNSARIQTRYAFSTQLISVGGLLSFVTKMRKLRGKWSIELSQLCYRSVSLNCGNLRKIKSQRLSQLGKNEMKLR